MCGSCWSPRQPDYPSDSSLTLAGYVQTHLALQVMLSNLFSPLLMPDLPILRLQLLKRAQMSSERPVSDPGGGETSGSLSAALS